MKIIRNAIQCLKCKDIIVSTHVHDFRWCQCKSVAVDGGNEYLKRTGDQRDYKEACIHNAANASFSSQELYELAGKFLVYNPEGAANPRVVYDRQEDAEDNVKSLRSAYKTGNKFWYVAELSSVK